MPEADHNEDRFPTLTRVLQALPNQEDFPEGQVQRVQIELHASGDATYRVWEPRADEPASGYIAAEELS
jgi:hypothetical protein